MRPDLFTQKIVVRCAFLFTALQTFSFPNPKHDPPPPSKEHRGQSPLPSTSPLFSSDMTETIYDPFHGPIPLLSSLIYCSAPDMLSAQYQGTLKFESMCFRWLSSRLTRRLLAASICEVRSDVFVQWESMSVDI